MGTKRWKKPAHSLASRALFGRADALSITTVGLLSFFALAGCASSRAYNAETGQAFKTHHGSSMQASSSNQSEPSSVNAEDEAEAPDTVQEGDEKDPEVVRAPDGSHISDVGGDALLDASAEAEVEATSVVGSSAADQEDSLANVPAVSNERVDWWINYYTGRGRERFQRHLDHADSYAPMVQGILRDNEVADELFYIALIESGFITKARSHAGAVGVWQFIRGTGKRYGLVIGRGIDERKDPMRATVAAARYMTDLYNIFNDWYLAFAAYNCGEYRVLRAIVAGKTRDFWKLSELGLLPKETRHYVPKFLAAMQIARNREQYGFQSNAVAARPELKPVSVPGGTRLIDLAKSSEISLEDLVSANPHLLNKRVPTTSKAYPVWVPAAAAERAVAARSQLPAASRVLSQREIDESNQANAVEFHRVARGETLTSIAHEYGTSVKKLRRLNGFNKPKVNLRIGQRIKISGPNPALVQTKPAKRSPVALADASSNGAGKQRQQLAEEEYVFYRVRSGDNLNKIGKRFGVGAEQIKEANSLGRNELYAGEVLRVPATGG